MVYNTRIQKFWIREIIISIVCLGIAGCIKTGGQISMTPSDRIPELVASAASIELPGYLLAVWPMPVSVTEESEYLRTLNSTTQGGVGARLLIDQVYPYFVGEEFGKVEYSAQNSLNPLEHIEFLVDGEKVSQELLRANGLSSVIVRDHTGMLLYSGVSQMDLFWCVPLAAGEHIVSLHIYNANKAQILEFDWTFTISD